MAQTGKNFIKKLLSSKLFLFLIIVVLIALIVSLLQESYRKYQLTKEINNLKSEIERLEGNNKQMANLMEYFKEESYMEKEARLKLNLKKPGEKVVILSPGSTEPAEEENIGEDSSSGKPIDYDNLNIETANYWKWWEYFFRD